MISTNWGGFKQYKQLASAFGPPGMEGPVRDEMNKLLKPYARVIKTDSIGNLYAFMGPDKAPTVMISAHMDEVALVVNGVTEQGFIRVIPQGFLKLEHFFLQHVTILGTKSRVLGVANIAREHRRASMSDILVDVGARSALEVNKFGIRLGDRVCFSPQIYPLGPDMIVGKASDDRTGLYVLVEVARRLMGKDLAVQLVFVGTVQEEGMDTFVTWVGAHIAAQRLGPVLMLGVDTIDSGDWMPGINHPGTPQINLTGGVGILRGAQDLHPDLVDYLLARARANGIQHQIIPLAATVADYTAVSRAREGIPCAGLAIPIRHSHSASEIFHWRTVEDTINLILDVLSEPLELLRIARQLH